MKPILKLFPALAAALVQVASAQEITPKWFEHINASVGVAETNKLPILKKQGTPTESLDGTDSMDAYRNLIRYDSTRLLLGVGENGINESDPSTSAADKALAAAYPDHSLIWLDSETGRPLGLAWQESFRPDLLAGKDVTTVGQSSSYVWWRVALDDGPAGQRALYSAFKHLILRYAPKAGGGWETTPTVAYEEQIAGVGDGLSNGDGSLSWRFRDFHVKGSGTNTVILAGGGTWRAGHHPQVLVTTDGLNFTPKGRVDNRDNGARRNDYALGGLSSFPVEYPNNFGGDVNPKISVVYAGHFPGTGFEARPNRYASNPAKPVPSPEYNQQPNVSIYVRNESGADGLPAFYWEAAGKDGKPIDYTVDGTTRYDGNWNAALATDKDIDYIVAYSMPSWNNVLPKIDPNGDDSSPRYQTPAWLAIHRLDGSIASGNSSFKLDFRENDEPIADQVPVGHDYLYDPWIEVYPDTNAPANLKKAEVLVSFGSAGFGAFTVQNVAATLVSSPASQTVAAGSTVTLTANVTGSPNSFQWYRNGVPLPAAPYFKGYNKVALTIVGVTPADAGSYQLKWVNPVSGAGQTVAANLTVTGTSTRWAGATDVFPGNLDPAPAPGLVVTNASSFTIKAGGFAAFDHADTETLLATGDFSFFRYEELTGDFDKRVRLASFTNLPVDPNIPLPDPADVLARAGLMLRQSTSANTPTLDISVYNPNNPSSDYVKVAGRGRVDQIYSQTLSRTYPGVSTNLPNQWLRMRRVGNAFAFYVSTNGTSWSLVSEQYQKFPATVLFGTFASPDNAEGSSYAVAEFADYGDVTATDTVAPTLVSVGTLDGKTIGVKFSEPVNSVSATQLANYTVSGVTVVAAAPGISPNTVYLKVAGLVSASFTVTVSGVVDEAGNAVAAGSSAAGKISNWAVTDVGYIQNPANRPTLGDDPYLTGQAVAVSSDTNPEIEIVGGGSNAYNPGDFITYVYKSYPGDFDVVVAVNRFDKRGIAGGYANSGIHVRKGLYREDTTAIAESTKVPAYVNIVYYEASGPNRAAIQLNRPNPGDGYGNNNPNMNTEVIDGLMGWFTGLTTVNAAGTVSPQSSPTQAHWLRVKRTGTKYTALFSYDGVTWVTQDQPELDLPNLSGSVLVGFANQNDTGYGVPPDDTYGGNGTLITLDDGTKKNTQNESNYGVLRISSLGDFATAFPNPAPVLTIKTVGANVVLSWTGTGYTLQSAASITGAFAPAGLPVVTAGGVNTVTVNPGNGAAFYRLQ